MSTTTTPAYDGDDETKSVDAAGNDNDENNNADAAATTIAPPATSLSVQPLPKGRSLNWTAAAPSMAQSMNFVTTVVPSSAADHNSGPTMSMDLSDVSMDDDADSDAPAPPAPPATTGQPAAADASPRTTDWALVDTMAMGAGGRSSGGVDAPAPNDTASGTDCTDNGTTYQVS